MDRQSFPEPNGSTDLTRDSNGELGMAGRGLPDEMHLVEYFKVLLKRRRTIAVTFVAIFALAIVYTFTATPVYQARVALLIEADAPRVLTFTEVIEESQSPWEFSETQHRILRSRPLARKTIEALGLWDRYSAPRAQPGMASPAAALSVSGAIVSIRTAVGRAFGSGDSAAEPPARDETAEQSVAIDRFLGGLTVAAVRNSRIVEVLYHSADAELATRIVNELARQYIGDSLEVRFQASKDASDWLGKQLADQRKQVEAAEMALQRFREQNDGVAVDDRQNIVTQKLADLNAAVTVAKTERIAREAAFKQLEAAAARPSGLDADPAVLSNAFIQQLKVEVAALEGKQRELSETLGDKHPEMIKVASAAEAARLKLTSEIGKVVQAVRSEYQAAVVREDTLVAALNGQKTEALAQTRKHIAYSALERDATVNRQIFESLLQRMKETGLSGELRATNVRIVESAEIPRHPVAPNKAATLLFGLLAGLIGAVALAFFVEYLDNRIKLPQEVAAHLGLTCLGLVPAVAEKNAEKSTPLINNGVPASFVEAFRAIRTNVLFSAPQQGSRIIVVTSTGPNEGKSVVASNLALALAQAGQRVLLIDADMRRPQVHKFFDRPQEPGLSNLIVGSSRATETLAASAVNGLWVLTAGRIPPDPAELLGSPQFKTLLGSVTDQFEWVVIDSPPVMAVTDACVVAHSSHDVIFVVGAEMTQRRAARAAVSRLLGAKARFLGVVLNRVDLQHDAYYYSDYYRHEYASYQAAGQPV